MCNAKSFEQCDRHLDVEFYGGRVSVFILAVAPPVIFKICFPFRNSFLLSRSLLSH